MNPHQAIQDQINLTIEKVESGHTHPLDALIKLRGDKYLLKQSLELIDAFEADNLELLSSEVDAYGGQYNGYDIQVRSGGKTFSFRHIPEWQEVEAKKKEVEAKYKSYFDASQKGMMAVSEDGEEILIPEVSYRKASVILKKLAQ